MPFQRRYDRDAQTYIVDRTLTGAPRPVPSTGQAQAADGSIVGAVANADIPPATPIPVSIPGINELVVDSRGAMSPRWWRFFEELYRRTGAIEDNINSFELILGDSATTVALVLSGVIPTLSAGIGVSAKVLTLTGTAPTAVNTGQLPGSASLTLTGTVPTVS